MLDELERDSPRSPIQAPLVAKLEPGRRQVVLPMQLSDYFSRLAGAVDVDLDVNKQRAVGNPSLHPISYRCFNEQPLFSENRASQQIPRRIRKFASSF